MKVFFFDQLLCIGTYYSPALKKVGAILDFSGLKLDTHMDSWQMYRVYRNQGAPAYSSLYFFIFLSLQFSNIENFRHTFLRNCEA